MQIKQFQFGIMGWGLALGLAMSFLPASATIKIPGIFNDHMVLQRDMPIPIWGWADQGESVQVTFSGQTESTVADAFGCWEVTLDPESANAVGQDLTIGGTTVSDVLVGEVWICSGSTSMDLPVRKVLNKTAELAAANYPSIRLAKVSRNHAFLPQKDATADWLPCDPDSISDFSATGYFFARKIHQELGVPVGVIQATYTRSTALYFMPAEGYRDTPALSRYLDNIYDSRPATAEGQARWEDYLAELSAWRPKALAAVAAGEIPVDHPEIPNDLWVTYNVTTAVFNGMIAPLIPYAMRGVIWAEGDVERRRADEYYHHMTGLIDSWRLLWDQGNFPFHYVQIPRFNPVDALNDAGTPLMRDVQRQGLAINNTGMAVSMDIEAPDETDNVNKQDAGLRLALWALANDYGQTSLVHSGPLYSKIKLIGSEAHLFFDHVGAGLMVGEKVGLDPVVEIADALASFEIAGADEQYYPATATVSLDEQKVIVSAPEVIVPRSIRYGYNLNPETSNLYNRDGLPASSFVAWATTYEDYRLTIAWGGGDSTALGDADNDGRSNRFEYAFGLNPMSSSDESALSHVMTEEATVKYLEISYLENLRASDVNYACYESIDLQVWDPMTPDPADVSTEPTADINYQKVSVRVPISGDKKFLKVEAQ